MDNINKKIDSCKTIDELLKLYLEMEDFQINREIRLKEIDDKIGELVEERSKLEDNHIGYLNPLEKIKYAIGSMYINKEKI